MNRLIFALGNPSQQYNFTRHNFGFLALDFYAKTHDITFIQRCRFTAQIAEYNGVIFAKPTTFYNEVGSSLIKIIKFYKIRPEDILVVCDDFTLPFGQLRHRATGSAGGNNGLKSIIEHLGTDQFPRLRLGTDSPLRQKLGDTDFVLSRFTDEEKQQLPTLLSKITTQINTLTQS